MALKTLGFLVTVVVKTTLDRIKKLDSDLRKSCREGTAETYAVTRGKQHGCTAHYLHYLFWQVISITGLELLQS